MIDSAGRRRIIRNLGLLLFERDQFAVQRQEIDALFTSRAHTGTTSEMSETIYKKVREMQDELRKHIREIVTQEYMEARKFLDRLSLEGRFPIG